MSLSDDDESQNNWRRIVWGLFGAAFMAYFAYDCFVTHEATVGRSWSKSKYVLHGYGAFIYGLQFAFAASALHFQYFWAYFPKYQRLRSFVTRFSLTGWGVTLVILCIYALRHSGQTSNM